MKQQVDIRSHAKALKWFKEIDADKSGRIDRMEFIHFELLRQGVPSGTADIMQKFGKIDADGDGTLDFSEFEAYVRSL